MQRGSTVAQAGNGTGFESDNDRERLEWVCQTLLDRKAQDIHGSSLILGPRRKGSLQNLIEIPLHDSRAYATGQVRA